MAPLHGMAAEHSHPESAGRHIISRLQRRVGVRSVPIEDIHRILAPGLLCLVNKPVGQRSVIGRSRILAADADRMLVAVIVRPDKPDINGHKLLHLRRHIRPPETDLLKMRKRQKSPVLRLQPVVGQVL